MPDCGSGVTSLCSRIPAPTATRKCMCRCTCRSLTAPAAPGHHSQETVGLDLPSVTVLRCQGHPAAPPRSPPQRGPAAGARGISVRLHRPGAGRTGRRGPGRAAGHADRSSPPWAGPPPPYCRPRPRAGPRGRAYPDAAQQDPRTHAAPRPARTLSRSAATAGSGRSAPAPPSPGRRPVHDGIPPGVPRAAANTSPCLFSELRDNVAVQEAVQPRRRTATMSGKSSLAGP